MRKLVITTFLLAFLLVFSASASELILGSRSSLGDSSVSFFPDWNTDDGYVPGEDNAGSSKTLAIGKVSYGENQAYLSFNMSRLPNNAIITSATLYIYEQRKRQDIRVYTYLTESFDENKITWYNKPFPVYLCSMQNVKSVGGVYLGFDVKNCAQATVNNREKSMSLVLLPRDNLRDDTYLELYSKENGSNTPYLKIQYYVPKDTSIWNKAYIGFCRGFGLN